MLTTLICFVLGIVLVGAGAVLCRYLLHREPALARRRAAVLEITHRPTRIEAGRTELARTRSEIMTLNRELERLRDRLADWLPLEDTADSAWKFVMVAVLLSLLEAILFLLYGLGSGFGNAPAWLLALIAPPTAAITILLIHVMLAAALGSRHRPSQTLRRARIGLVAGILAVILAVWAVLGGRNLTDVGAIETLTAVGLMILASTTSLAGGFSALVATTLAEERRLERTVVQLEARLQALEEHRTAIEEDLARMGSPPRQHSSAGLAAPAGLVALLLLASLGSEPASAQSLVPVTIFPRGGVCEILIDLTTSVNPIGRRDAIARTREDLPTMADALGCNVVRIVPFSGNLLNDVTEVPIPPAIDPVAACSDAMPARVSGVTATTAMLYPAVRDARVRQAREACQTSVALQQQSQAMARRQALAQAASALGRAATLSPRGNCTALNLAVRRALQRAQHVAAITDGVNTCPTPAVNVPIEKFSTLLFLIVPNNHDSPDAPEAVFARLDALQRAFPGSQALLLPELTPTFWRQSGR